MRQSPRPIALAVDDQFYLSRLAFGEPLEAPAEQVTRLFFEGLIERCGKRWTLSQAGRDLMLGDPHVPLRDLQPPSGCAFPSHG